MLGGMACQRSPVSNQFTKLGQIYVQTLPVRRTSIILVNYTQQNTIALSNGIYHFVAVQGLA